MVKIAGDDVTLQVLRVRKVFLPMQRWYFWANPTLKVSDQLPDVSSTLFGDPIDGGPSMKEEVEIGGPSVNPVRRKTTVRTDCNRYAGIDLEQYVGVRSEDSVLRRPRPAFQPGDGNVALRAETDKIILGGMGMTNDDYLTLRMYSPMPVLSTVSSVS